jgi:hypothetical protein
MKTFKTKETVTVINYPYGRLQCKATFGLEFKKGKGYRTTFQTVNPKTGRINNMKRSVYSSIMRMIQNEETGRISYDYPQLGDIEKLNDTTDYLNENFDTFTNEEIIELYVKIKKSLLVEIYVMATYCGADLQKVKALLMPLIDICKKGIIDFDNKFLDIKVDVEKLHAEKIEGYQPFKVKKGQ